MISAAQAGAVNTDGPGIPANTYGLGSPDRGMKRLPTLDDTEHGHTRESAYLAGDADALDTIDTQDAYRAAMLAEWDTDE